MTGGPISASQTGANGVTARLTITLFFMIVAVGVLAAACGGWSATSGSPSASSTPTQATAAATAYLQVRTQMLVRDAPTQTLRQLCAPSSGLANSVLWWAAGTRSSARGREIGVPRQGYNSASVTVMVRRVTVDEQAGTAGVLTYTTPGPGDTRFVDSSAAYHLVRLVRTGNGRWLATADTSTAYDRDLPVFLMAGGAPPGVVVAARAEVLREKHPGKAPAGSLTPLRAWCAAMNARDAAALKAAYTPDSDIQSMTDAQVAAGFFASSSPPNRRDWHMMGMRLLGTQLDGVACGWVTYRFMSDEVAKIPGSRGFAAFAFVERQADGRWLIFSPPE